MLAPSTVASSIQLEDGGLDAKLVGNGIDNRVRQRLFQAQQPAQVAHEGELHGKAEPVVRAAVPPRECQVLGRQGTSAQGIIAVGRRVEQKSTRVRREELGGQGGHGISGRKASHNPTRNIWTGQPFWT